jgi:acylphosphatase
MIKRRLRITGKVQGVGFRYSLQEQADRLGITGWVRNRRDGDVEALVAGDAAAVEAVIAWARRGPRGARVTEIHIEEAGGAEPDHREFRIDATI